ncbi:MAG: hypothetical protein SH868_07500 [Bythopirellula sp.]|nr:hypothetical protein [Bythopirellula sp.]
MVNNPDLYSWLRDICGDHLDALGIPWWHAGQSLCFNYRGIDVALWLAAFPNPFDPENGPPVCCLGIPARLLTLYRSEITNSAEFVGGLLDELLDELNDWN